MVIVWSVLSSASLCLALAKVNTFNDMDKQVRKRRSHCLLIEVLRCSTLAFESDAVEMLWPIEPFSLDRLETPVMGD